ncbi:proton-dependent oligopeptide transporter, POT family [Tenacibaculum sp. MAR_2009_124]|uniref:POT-type proton-dependent oligopeptide transporter n=1 Tax=Tenacibaculum sp. MAR_2009_124 TaxID=1250059 RepID=UPI000899ACED|nr:MFS transporter [Tenacibaculum sp. MAR_2009_124]SEC25896.1 proton-dependent oligopeptide transporter, POT family [Tenacibaculum sp. MAR_2009_124]
MENNQHQKHTKEIYNYAISSLLEKAAYYGLRAIAVLYMIGETLKMENREALTIYGWFTASLVFSGIVGAIFGDLLIGNKKAILIGGVMQAIGAFVLCIPSLTGLYTGLFFVIVGSGFFTPNITSNFGKLYLKRTRLLDSGFTLLYSATNIGAFLGILVLGYLGEKYGYNIGFAFAGILMLISLIPILSSKEVILENDQKCEEFPLGKRVFSILVTCIIVGLFWGLYQMSNIRIFDLQLQLRELSTSDIPSYFWESINSVFVLPISLIMYVLWTYFYSSQFFKLLLGFVFGATSLGILYLIPEAPTEEHTITYLVSIIFLGIAEVHIAPIIHSVLTKYSNPKYLAILISLSFLPTRLIYVIFGLFNEPVQEYPLLGVKFGIKWMTVIGVLLIGLVIWAKRSNKK